MIGSRRLGKPTYSVGILPLVESRTFCQPTRNENIPPHPHNHRWYRITIFRRNMRGCHPLQRMQKLQLLRVLLQERRHLWSLCRPPSRPKGENRRPQETRQGLLLESQICCSAVIQPRNPIRRVIVSRWRPLAPPLSEVPTKAKLAPLFASSSALQLPGCFRFWYQACCDTGGEIRRYARPVDRVQLASFAILLGSPGLRLSSAF
jgi:hypothetical protein